MLRLLSCLVAFGSAWLNVCLAAPQPLVNHSDTWHFRKGTNAPQSNWKTMADDGLDTTWLIGSGGFGYADNAPETVNCQTLLSDMQTGYTTLYVRRQVVITNAVAADAHLMLRMDWDDGFIAWLDGNYLTSVNVSGAPAEPASTSAASGGHESSLGNSTPQRAVTNDLGLASNWLAPGTHTLAILGLNQNSSSDFILVADLYLDTPPPPVTNRWPASASPIVITTNVTIADNSVLVIEPGVTVALAAGINLTVANGGRLLAEGTSNAPIRFTRSGASGYWGSLTINGGPNSPESRVAYAEFEFNANATGTPCIDVNAGTVFLDHLTFRNTGAPYIHVDGASFVISHCHFPSATAQFELCHGTGGVKAGGHGLWLRNFFGKPIGYNDVVDFTGGNRPAQPIVHFIENVFLGSDDDGLDLDGTDAWIEGNIFLHIHKNGATPDSASAISGGSNGGDTSEITVVGNLFYDCDQAATAKQGNFYTLLNNTVVHQTHQGGIDTDGAVLGVADAGTSQGAGAYLEGNIIHDAEQLVRYLTNAVVTFSNNLLPFAWAGPGGGNTTNDPMLKHVPQFAETVFTNWDQAQIMRDWFSLLPGSPAIGSGPNGRDRGGVIPRGAPISGEPVGATTDSNATLVVGFNRTGSAIPTSGFPNGSAYTHYRWRLDAGSWSAETAIAAPITLTNLITGPHHVEVSGKLDSGLFQDDPLFDELAAPSQSQPWRVIVTPVIENLFPVASNWMRLEFIQHANLGYTIEYRDSLATGAWQPLVILDPLPGTALTGFTDGDAPQMPMRFYRVVAW